MSNITNATGKFKLTADSGSSTEYTLDIDWEGTTEEEVRAYASRQIKVDMARHFRENPGSYDFSRPIPVKMADLMRGNVKVKPTVKSALALILAEAAKRGVDPKELVAEAIGE
tara:strand:+ start:640 stop:978 length:339 start_codon:yes stop_codon:yes gene_type:complete